MRRLLLLLIIYCLSSPILLADTNDYVLGEIILKKNKCVYIDKGQSDGVEIGHKFDILYVGQKYGSGIISWVSNDICCARIDSMSFIRYSYVDPLEVKIYLVKPSIHKGGVLHVPFYQKLNLQPSQIITPDEQAAACLIYDGLVRLDSKGKIVPGLAHSWEIHGNTYTFYLNPDVKFHSGKPLDAMDVAYSLMRLAKADKVTPASSFILEVDGYKQVHFGNKNELLGVFIPNRHTIAITTNDAFVQFLKYLSGPAGYIIPNIDNPQNLPLPIGTGPYMIASLNDKTIKLAANKNYFESPPVLDSIIFCRYKNREEAALDFELGKLDIIFFDSQENRDLLTSGDYSARRYYTNSSVILGFNCKHSYQKNFELSKALQYLFDRESIIRVLLGNSAQKPNGIIPPTLNLESSNQTEYYFSPSDAKLMIEAIDNLPNKLNLVYDSLDPVLSSVADYIAAQLRHTGLKIAVRKADSRDLERSVALSTMDMFLFRYYLPVSDPDAFFYPLFSERLNGQTNYFNYENAQLQRYLDGVRQIDDAYTRDEIYLESEQLIINQPPLIILYNPIMTAAFRRDLAGFEPDFRGFVNIRNAHFQSGK
ncbi:MAG: ABC transporter substrate-binding protein [candidate division Zixibacteria bacterium]|nr:ABC transporter substrate-binding protein [candidate division Zixibacteria bacterium]